MPAVQKPKTKLAKCIHYCRVVTTFLFSHVGLCALVLAYAFLGAFTFHYLESTYEEEVRNNTQLRRKELVKSLWRLTENQTVLVRETWIENARTELQHFEDEIIRAVKHDGFDGKEFGAEPQWSVMGSMMYSIIVITTIGYGNIAPKTPAGRLVTMLYAIIGIPLTLICLSNIGDVMAHSFKFLYWKVCYTLCIKQKKRRRHRHHRRRPRHQVITRQPDSMPLTPPTTPYGMQNSPMYEQHAAASHPPPPPPPLPPSTSQFSDHLDANGVPIISNKYALQTEVQEPGHYGTYPTRERPNLPPLDLNRAQSQRQIMISSLPPQVATFDESDSYSESESSDEDEDEEEGNVPIIMCMSLVVGYICGGAWLFRQWEANWSYLDSAYFCFVTLTTIGFGDMVPGAALAGAGTDEGRTTLIICALYLLFGMALLAMSFNLVQDEVAKSVKNIGRKIGIISKGDK